MILGVVIGLTAMGFVAGAMWMTQTKRSSAEENMERSQQLQRPDMYASKVQQLDNQWMEQQNTVASVPLNNGYGEYQHNGNQDMAIAYDQHVEMQQMGYGQGYNNNQQSW
jgi:hypothetical protein